MAESTGIIVAAGGIAWGNDVILNGQPWSGTIPVIIATGIAALLFDGLEHVNQQMAVGIAWIALVTTILLPRQGNRSVAQNLINFTGLGSKKKK